MAKKKEAAVQMEMPGFERYSAREQRHLLALGEDLEALGESLRIRPRRRPYIYNVQLRHPLNAYQDVQMIVKAISEEGPVIAFHGGRTMVETIRTWPNRLNAGKVKWREDEYPPRNYEEIAAFVQAEVEYLVEKLPSISQGSSAT